MTSRVFITHSWHDIKFARQLYDDLIARGLEVWFDDKTLQAGHRVAEEINRGLEWCDVYIPILSPAALDSPWCWEEINAAISLSNDKNREGRPRVIPALRENCQIPAILRGRLYISFTDQYSAGLNKLIVALEAFRLEREREARERAKRERSEQVAREKMERERVEREKAEVYVAFAKTPPLVEGGKGVYRFERARVLALFGLFLAPILAFLFLFWILAPQDGSSSTPTLPPAATRITPSRIPLLGKCGGEPKSLEIPSSPSDFDRQFGYTIYDTSNSRRDDGGLALNTIRSMFVDKDGVWIGYGASSDGGVSYISNPDNNKRMWEKCADANGNPIGGLTNSIVKDNQGNLWVATDGQGIWRLRDGTWQQFVYRKTLPGSDNLPHEATYIIAAQANKILVGMLTGVMQYDGLVWIQDPVVGINQVHAIAVAPNGDKWIGFVGKGVRHIRSDGSYKDYTTENGLHNNNVRSIVIDDKGRVWIATWGGGISVFEKDKDKEKWGYHNASPSRLPSDNVMVVVKDRHGRIWAGTDKGASYFDFASMSWRVYTNLHTLAIGFGGSTRPRCLSNDEDVWIGTSGAGLIHGRLPAPSPVISDIKTSGVPERLAPGESFSPSITLLLEKGHKLAEGDFLHVADQTNYTADPRVAIWQGSSIDMGESYAFSFGNNRMVAPREPGQYQSTWRLWQCGRYVGPPITIQFTVQRP